MENTYSFFYAEGKDLVKCNNCESFFSKDTLFKIGKGEIPKYCPECGIRIDEHPQTLQDFCMTFPPTHTMCIVRYSGYIVTSIYIDDDHTFIIPESIYGSWVENYNWGHVLIREEENNDEVFIPCLEINIVDPDYNSIKARLP